MTRPTTAPPILERDFQRSVVELAELLGWKIYHVANVRGRLRAKSSIGFPDLLLTRAGRLIVAELKRDGREPTDAQQGWLDALALVPGITVACWRPADFDEIADVLSPGTRPATLTG